MGVVSEEGVFGVAGTHTAVKEGYYDKGNGKPHLWITKSMPTVFVQFDLSSLSCFQLLVSRCGISLFEVEDPHHTVVDGCWPTSLGEGRGTAGEGVCGNPS